MFCLPKYDCVLRPTHGETLEVIGRLAINDIHCLASKGSYRCSYIDDLGMVGQSLPMMYNKKFSTDRVSREHRNMKTNDKHLLALTVVAS